jgi:hypothetical protein
LNGMGTKNDKCLKMKAMPRLDKSDEEKLDRGLRILARIIARRHTENIHSKDVLEGGGGPLHPISRTGKMPARVWQTTGGKRGGNRYGKQGGIQQ